MDRIEFGRSVEHFPLGWSAARRDRRRFARLADVGEDALDWADNRTSAFHGIAAVEILETDVGSGSTCRSEHPIPLTANRIYGKLSINPVMQSS
jgi:hypothetical protein